jgi:hypothetical protein
MSEEVVASIWRRRVAWSKAADSLKRHIVWARATASILGVAGAAAATMAATCFADAPNWRTGFAAAGAVFIAVGTFVAARLLTVDALRAWTRARSVSEAIKTEVYTFRANAIPYADSNAADVLLEKTSALQVPARDLERYVADTKVGDGSPPPPLGPDYVAKRVEQQIEGYYRRKARQYSLRLTVFRTVEFLLGLAGTALGALATYFSAQHTSQGFATTSAAWVAVITTLGAAVATHVVASRYDFLVMSYYGTARRLEDLVNDWRIKGDASDVNRWSAFVKACEDAISVENESWLAKWMEKEPAKE